MQCNAVQYCAQLHNTQNVSFRTRSIQIHNAACSRAANLHSSALKLCTAIGAMRCGCNLVCRRCNTTLMCEVFVQGRTRRVYLSNCEAAGDAELLAANSISARIRCGNGAVCSKQVLSLPSFRDSKPTLTQHTVINATKHAIQFAFRFTAPFTTQHDAVQCITAYSSAVHKNAIQYSTADHIAQRSAMQYVTAQCNAIH